MAREKVEYYKPCSTCHNANCVWMGGKDTHKKCEDYQALEQGLKTVSIPEGATNGDVFKIMFNKTFPKTIILYNIDESRLTINPMFLREWWEIPYKEG